MARKLLHTELQLQDIDNEIKCSMQMTAANPDKCLDLFAKYKSTRIAVVCLAACANH